MTAGNTHSTRAPKRRPRGVSRAQWERADPSQPSQADKDQAAAGVESPVTRESLAPTWAKVKSRGDTARVIAGTMAFATAFALLGNELAGVTNASAGKAGGGVRIIVGGLTGTVLLLVLNEAGDAGATLAEGLAVVTLVSVVLVKGAPVWNWANKLFGSTPTGGSGGTSGTPHALRQPITNPQQLAQASTVHGAYVAPTVPTGGTP